MRALVDLRAWWLLGGGTLAAVVLMAVGQVRLAGIVAGAFLVLAAVCRVVAPEQVCGGLRVRSRWVDVTGLLLLAVAIVVATSQVRLAVG